MNSKDSTVIYWIAWLTCLSMYCFGFYLYHTELGSPANACFFKMQFNVACPACGGSHAIQSILYGSWMKALQYNVLATIIFIGCVLISFVLIYDALCTKNYFIKLYMIISKLLKIGIVRYSAAIALILLWALNVYRYRT